MLDYSLSMAGEKLTKLKDAAKELIREKHPKQEFAVFGFSANYNLITDFKADTAALIAAIDKIPDRGTNSTNLYGYYMEGLRYMALSPEYHTPDSIQQNFMIVFTDGAHTAGGEYTLNLAQQSYSGEDVFIIGTSTGSGALRQEDVAGMGTFMPVENISEVAEHFAVIQEQMLRDANSNYLLTYLSPRAAGNSTYEIEIKVKNNTNYWNNSIYQTTYTTTKFESATEVDGGVYINPYQTVNGQTFGIFGMDQNIVYSFAAGSSSDFKFTTYWAALPPEYQWTSSDESVAKVIYDKKEGFYTGKLITGSKQGQATLTLTDVANYNYVQSGKGIDYNLLPEWAYLYQRTLHVSFMQNDVDDISVRSSVYPNPVKDYLFIQSDSRIEKIEVYSITGNLVISQFGMAVKIGTGNLPAGIYLVKIYAENNTVIHRIIKE
ncbi:MAG: T9SS type A sorting domain-containing protein [Dysgonamonadaceae bacterium]|nr:T9SS type A sorting domain-containing protein [Dysgonamonadaceae bacterium]